MTMDIYYKLKTRFNLQWSNALSMSVLDYINQYGVTRGNPSKPSMFLTARNKYADTVCFPINTRSDPLQYIYTHSLTTEAAWNIDTVWNSWTALNYFNDTQLNAGYYKYVGVGCSCSEDYGVLCGFMFTKVYIGKLVTDEAPIYLPYSPAAICSGIGVSNTYTPSTCTSS